MTYWLVFLALAIMLIVYAVSTTVRKWEEMQREIDDKMLAESTLKEQIEEHRRKEQE
jgi:hypothetical protein